MLILSAASAPFFRSMWQFLRSAARHAREHRFRCYDLGLEPEQLEALQRALPQAEWRSLQPTGPLAHFAWKPPLIAENLRDEPVLWLDSASLLLGRLDPLQRQLERTGAYTPLAGIGRIRESTHPDTVAYLSCPPQHLEERHRAGGVCGFTPARRDLAQEWARLAGIPDCIAPRGASRANHRFDQSLLSLLLLKWRDEHGLELTRDEIDISSPWPVTFLATRRKLPNGVPLWLDAPARHLSLLARKGDILAWRAKCALSRRGQGLEGR